VRKTIFIIVWKKKRKETVKKVCVEFSIGPSP